MRITRKTYPGLLPRVVICLLVFGPIAAMLIFRDRIGKTNVETIEILLIILIPLGIILSVVLDERARPRRRR
jgi:hypothetical protein